MTESEKLLSEVARAIIADLERVYLLSNSSMDYDEGTGVVDYEGMFRPVEIAQAAIAIVLDRAAQACRDQQREFLSPEYATGQPLSSFSERFACGRCAEEILALHPAQPTREGV